MCMGGGKASSDADLAKSREIEKELRQDAKRLLKEVKLLLLGEFSSMSTPILINAFHAIFFRSPVLKLQCIMWRMGWHEL